MWQVLPISHETFCQTDRTQVGRKRLFSLCLWIPVGSDNTHFRGPVQINHSIPSNQSNISCTWTQCTCLLEYDNSGYDSLYISTFFHLFMDNDNWWIHRVNGILKWYRCSLVTEERCSSVAVHIPLHHWRGAAGEGGAAPVSNCTLLCCCCHSSLPLRGKVLLQHCCHCSLLLLESSVLLLLTTTGDTAPPLLITTPRGLLFLFWLKKQPRCLDHEQTQGFQLLWNLAGAGFRLRY